MAIVESRPALWPHQDRGIAQVQALIGEGVDKICLTSPTGGGKGRIICELIEHYAAMGWPISVYINRKVLLEQTIRVLSEAGIEFGVRASEMDCITSSEKKTWPRRPALWRSGSDPARPATLGAEAANIKHSPI